MSLGPSYAAPRSAAVESGRGPCVTTDVRALRRTLIFNGGPSRRRVTARAEWIHRFI
jgi:hypothetical protein